MGLDHHLDHCVGWVERSETQHFVFVGFRSSTQPTFHALAEIMIKADPAGLIPGLCASACRQMFFSAVIFR
jgi:hypothetical protein